MYFFSTVVEIVKMIFFIKHTEKAGGQNPTRCFSMQFASYEEPVISGEGQNEQAKLKQVTQNSEDSFS